MDYPQSARKGDIIKLNNADVLVKNSFILNRDDIGEYYTITVSNGNNTFTIDKDKLGDVICYKNNKQIYMLEWKNDMSKKFIYANINQNNVNIINYICGDCKIDGNRKFNNKIIRNDQPYNFRKSNLMPTKNVIETSVNNTNVVFISLSKAPKAKLIPNPIPFFEGDNITILKECKGHIKTYGQTANIARNGYKIISIGDNQKKYCEVFLNKYGINGNEFTFLIDETDINILSNVKIKNLFYNMQNNDVTNNANNIDKTEDNMDKFEDDITNPIDLQKNIDDEIIDDKYNKQEIETYRNTIKYNKNTIKEEYITVLNPTWQLDSNQYIVLSFRHLYNNEHKISTIYLHRYLLQYQLNKDNNTIDHINGNKFDNRRCNLRSTNMSIQNMNRGMVKRKTNLHNLFSTLNNKPLPNPIVNDTNTLTIINTNQNVVDHIVNVPNVELLTNQNNIQQNQLAINTNYDFIYNNNEIIKNKKSNTKRYYFDIQISAARCEKSFKITDNSTKSEIKKFKNNHAKVMTIKLAHAICIRYIYINKYPCIIKYSIDNKIFTTVLEFKIYTDQLITNIMNNISDEQDQYTIDTFLDYMNTLKIPKYIDIRTQKQASVDTPINNINFKYIQYISDRDKYDAQWTPGTKKITKNGSGSVKLTNDEKKCFALVQRYNLFIELENELNNKIHGDILLSNTININTTTIKSLTDAEFDTEKITKFSNFDEFKLYTEECINKFLLPETQQYTLDTFATYITKKINTKKTQLTISTLKYNYPMLVTKTD